MTANDWVQQRSPVVEYCTEEVRRQGHDVCALDGIQRVAWMLDAWSMAIRISVDRSDVTSIDIEHIGRMVEPYKNASGFRTCEVTVGGRSTQPSERVPENIARLVDAQRDMPPLEFYKNFELVHPFVDGNGRSGKILLNWLNGSLLNPIFPPADIFGYAIANP